MDKKRNEQTSELEKAIGEILEERGKKLCEGLKQEPKYTWKEYGTNSGTTQTQNCYK